jgi:glycosyltransferase involved in cell wall biosynthesis
MESVPQLEKNRARPQDPIVSVVIPTLNEARNLRHVLESLSPEVDEVVIVDGHSVDDTVDVARAVCPDAKVLLQNRAGKGNALACGVAHCTGDIVVLMDADGSTDPTEIRLFVSALVNGADFAKGSRFAVGGGSLDITRLRRVGNRALGGLVNVLCRTKYTDLCYGFNAFWRDQAFALGLTMGDASAGRLWGDGFEIESLINLRAARHRLRIMEIPSVEHPRLHGVSNLNAFPDGVRVLRTILAEWHRSSESTSRSLRATVNPPHSHETRGVAYCPPIHGAPADCLCYVSNPARRLA